MLQLLGSVALSDFRQTQLLEKISMRSLNIPQFSASFTYFIDTATTLDPQNLQKLCGLLEDKQTLKELSTLDYLPSSFVLITPRIGTQSAWSSKATDIAINCNLKNILRIERGILYSFTQELAAADLSAFAELILDRMTESALFEIDQAAQLFDHSEPKPLDIIDIQTHGQQALDDANQELGLALSKDEIIYLYQHYIKLKQNPTDAEVTMFAQANSEHCRHKIFNADWIIDGKVQDISLFGMIKNTYQKYSEISLNNAALENEVLSAYHDNSAVIAGYQAKSLLVDKYQQYQYVNEKAHITIKVETHNHPTAISPFAGAATGAGGEIRDGGATGIGAKPKAGLSGFCVSDLKLAEAPTHWLSPTDLSPPDLSPIELSPPDLSPIDSPTPYIADYGKPHRIASALDIMLQGPLGSAAFNNEFGRAAITGYFRTFQMNVNGEQRGYHKPIMLAGGMGNIRPMHVAKKIIPAGSLLIVLGGPALNIGLGGGAASSQDSGIGAEDLDFASVQRGNPEMERRAQEVIERLRAMGAQSLVISIHDVGAGGLSNALPELINDAGKGGIIELRHINNDEKSMSPREIWSNEAQERYVLAIAEQDLPEFSAICERERCPFAVVGTATDARNLKVYDAHFSNAVVNLPMEVLLGKPPKMTKNVQTRLFKAGDALATNLNETQLVQMAQAVLRHPTVADKTFLISIGDRTVGGLTARDQMVGRFQVPVADCGVTASGFESITGEAFALGERPPLALLNPAASARMAVAESITNIAAARIENLRSIKLSANWMAACGHAGEDVALFDAVKAIGMEMCPALGIAIPVGKDSLSMKTRWSEHNLTNQTTEKAVISPLSVVITAFAPVLDVTKTLTPELKNIPDARILLIDLGAGKNRLGGSIFGQVQDKIGDIAPDCDNFEHLKNFFTAIQTLNAQNIIHAYHDRSDGGLFATLAEMIFASGLGLEIKLDSLGSNLISALFNEELGAVIQVKNSDMSIINKIFKDFEIDSLVHDIGSINNEDALNISHKDKIIFKQMRCTLRNWWSKVSFAMQSRRDHPKCAQEAYALALNPNYQGLFAKLSPDLEASTHSHNHANTKNLSARLNIGVKPKIAILREQGVNSQVEMAAGFDLAGFDTFDIHMSDILNKRVNLADFQGLVAAGGFSYGDVLGSGMGWAKSILYNDFARKMFEDFFKDKNKFGLGVCNGCQMLAGLHEIIPGASHWPLFTHNLVAQYEARLVQVEIAQSNSMFFNGMIGSQLPIVISHGEGRPQERNDGDIDKLIAQHNVALRFIDDKGAIATTYPLNPNGAVHGITGVTNDDGRILAMMPHPERTLRPLNFSYLPDGLSKEKSPWLQVFMNARRFVA
ncbi:phosphoribosylformyl-glycineamide synthetase [Gammaproteobacteria bacterium]|nr:phosphoribosylformyl-glycineamide synthetase [Gammaproteobacteria bacterium]